MNICKYKRIFIILWITILIMILMGIFFLWPPGSKEENIQQVMRDGVLHEHNKMSFFGLLVNPAVISAYMVTVGLLLSALLIRIFVIPRFTIVPGKFQNILELTVTFFSDMASANSPHRPRFIGAYIFSAGIYLFFGTLFELLGVPWLTTNRLSFSLPAPVSDINAAIAMGILSYSVILGAGIIHGGIKGCLGVLKDFSLPISMSFRLFGSLLSGLLVTELVYYYISLSFVLPVIVGVMFTLIHALVQAYVLATLVSIFYGEAAEPKSSKKT